MPGPGGVERGRIAIRVLPDTSRFAVSLQRYLDRVETRARLRVAVVPDLSGFAADLRARLAATRARVQVPVAPDTADFADRLRAGLSRTSARVQVPVTPDASGFAARLRAELSRLPRRIEIPVRLALPRVELARLQAQLSQGQALRLPVRLHVSRLEIAQLQAQLAGLRPRPVVRVRVTPDSGGSLSGLSRSIGGVSAVASGAASSVGSLSRSLTLVTALGVSAVPVVAGLSAALAQMAPAAALAAPAVISLGLAGAGVAVAFRGVGDALSGDIDALARLTPAARAAVTAMRGWRPELGAIRRAVQERFFDGLARQIESAGRTALPVLQTALEDTAGALNGMASGVLMAAQRLAEHGTLGAALASANRGLSNLQGLPGQIVGGLFQIGAAAGPSFERLTSAAGSAMDGVSRRLTAAFESGALASAIETAIGLVRQFGRILGNIGGVIGSVFQAANVSGAGFLNTLETITDALADVFASPEVQRALSALFETMSTLATTAAPLLVSALQVVAPVLSALGPPVQRLIEDLGAGLQPVIAALGPVMLAAADTVGDLADALGPLLPIAGELIAHLGPSLTPIFVGLGEVIQQLTPTVQTLVAQMAGEEGLGGVLRLLPQLIQPLMDILVSLAPVIAAVATVTMALNQVFIDQIATTLETIVIPALNAVAALLRGDFSSALDYALEAAVGFVTSTVAAITTLPRLAFEALADLASRLWDRMTEAGADLLDAAGGAIADAADKVGELPGAAGDALGDLGSFLYDSGRALIQGFIDGITSMATSVTDAIGGLLGRARDFLPFSPAKRGPFSGRGWTLYSGRSISESLADGILDRQGQVRAAAQSVAGVAQANLAGMRASVVGTGAAIGPTELAGALYLDSGEFLGAVRGAVVDAVAAPLASTLNARRRR